MNSRSELDESSLVNFPTDLPPLDTKDSLLGFPFDHLYACHSDSADQRDELPGNKEIDLAAQCLIGEDKNFGLTDTTDVVQLNERLAESETQNKRLKDLLVYHLDLIQQQNDLITRRDKLYQSLRLENESLKIKLNRRHGLILPPPPPPPPPVILPPPPPPPLPVHIPLPLPLPLPVLPSVPTATLTSAQTLTSSLPSLPPSPSPTPTPTLLPSSTITQLLTPTQTPTPTPTPTPISTPTLSIPVTSTVVKTDPSKVMLDSFSELLLPEKRSNSYMYDTDLSAPKKEVFGIARTTIPEPDAKSYNATETGATGNTDASKTKYSTMRTDLFKPIDSKRSLIKKETTKPEPRSKSLYTITSTGGNPVIQRVQRNRKKNTTGVGHLSRMAKTTPKAAAPEPTKQPDEPEYDHFGINKKNKFINTYGKSKFAITSTTTSTTTTLSKRSTFGSLSERLQLIDTTPTGEDPYQLGEADLREQSPIPKLMLQKTNHGRMRVMDQPTRRIYDPDSPEPKTPRGRSNRFLSSTFTEDLKKEAKTLVIQDPDLDLVKTEPEINWRIYSPKFKTSIETCASSTPPLPIGEFSFADANTLSALNLSLNLNLDCEEFQDLFADSLNIEDLNIGRTLNTAQKTTGEAEVAEISQEMPTDNFMTPLLDSINTQITQPTEDFPELQFSQGSHHERVNSASQYQFEETTQAEDAYAFTPIEPILPTPPPKESKRGRKRAYSTTGVGKGKGTKAPPKPRARGRGRGGGARRTQSNDVAVASTDAQTVNNWQPSKSTLQKERVTKTPAASSSQVSDDYYGGPSTSNTESTSSAAVASGIVHAAGPSTSNNVSGIYSASTSAFCYAAGPSTSNIVSSIYSASTSAFCYVAGPSTSNIASGGYAVVPTALFYPGSSSSTPNNESGGTAAAANQINYYEGPSTSNVESGVNAEIPIPSTSQPGTSEQTQSVETGEATDAQALDESAAGDQPTPTPGMTTTDEYHTNAGVNDAFWYYGLDSDLKLEDIEFESIVDVSAAVEVPRWREINFATIFTEDCPELLDDRIFEKRHQKLEAEERRQLRWHMRRIREQRHVEKLKQRHRDSWCTTVTVPAVYTVWPRPQRDIRFIEITDTLPVTAFGEILPDLPKADFMLPWVRTSKALKRSKRSKTLH